MTVQQAQAEINKYEQDITNAHSSLCSAARMVGSRAKVCAEGIKTRKTLFPLLISLIGILIFFGSAWLWFMGLVLVVVGIAIAYSGNQSANSMVSRVEAVQKTLNGIIDNNSKI